MRASHEILFASTNADKLAEFQALLAAYPEVKLLPAAKILRNAEKLAKVEIFQTYVENAMAKARFANQGAHYPCLADDSGLEIEALGNQPGPRTARYAAATAGQSQDQANMAKVLDELKGRPREARRAQFVCCLALVMEGVAIHVNGVLKGTIAEAPMGSQGFGYDPIFIPDGHTKTLAQMGDADKNRISHRAAALQLLMEEIRRRGLILARP
ncbi:MAG: RdgB/HAM1 family non-canonical purine NTP pyrophosphatase [Bdellovibrionales bacterium]|nr:RdgB/HAM1 family non-canonical purine NTP pyrophosphatase [Bdellovibrionales bacterium]